MTETPMRERLARAICGVSCTACPENGTCWDWKPILPEIDAILAEAERPSEGMLIAARDWSQSKYGKPIGNDAAIGCFGAMIRAAREGK